MPPSPQWLQWAQQLQAISQAGLTYAKDSYDQIRYEDIRRISAEMIAHQSNEPFEKIHSIFQNQTGYPTPKVDVRAAIFKDQKILLVKEKEDGKWTLPGGWADILESPSEAIIREVREEAGFHVKITKLLAVYDRSKHPHTPPFPFHVFKLFFQGEISGGEATTSNETTDVAFFAQEKLPELSSGRVTPWQINRLFEHYAHPEWPTDFD